MKTAYVILVFFGLMLSSSFLYAEDKKGDKIEKQKTQKDHSFEDLLVQGKYHFSNEAVTTVEEDKVLDSLIGVRVDFKDRLIKSSGQY